MSLVDTFVRFFLISPAERKLILFGTCEKLRLKTNPIREKLSHVAADINFEFNINVGLNEM